MTAPYGPLTVGRLVLTEPWEVTVKASDGKTLALAGQEAVTTVASPTQVQLRDRATALVDYEGRVVPVTFAGFPHLDGYYRVGTPGYTESTWYDQTVIEWDCDLTLIGGPGSVEFESRMVGGNRPHVSAAVAELWHAPPAGARAYMVGSASPGYVDRAGETGTVRVYRGLPAGGNPRWGSTLAGYLAGAVSVTVNSTVLTGVRAPDTPGSWHLSNGVLRVAAREATGTLRVTSYLTSGWGTSKVFDIKRNGVSLGAAQSVTVLRNDPEECVVRLTWDHAPARSTLDVALKRGARHVALCASQSNVSGVWRIDDNGGGGTVDDQLAAAGYIASAADDGDGNRWVIGTGVACAAAGVFGLAATTPAQTLAGYVGCVRGGASPAAGDAAAEVNAQWMGTPAESERVIQR